VTHTRTLPKDGGERATPQKPEITARIASGVVLAAVAVGAALASSWTFLPLVIGAGVILAWEWGRLVRGGGFDGTALIQATGAAVVATLVTLGRPGLALAALVVALLAIGVANRVSDHLGWSIAGLIYVALPAWSFVWLRSDQGLGAVAVLYVFAVAWTTDTASYAAGRLIGGPKLAPRISPGKTWSGFVIGSLAPALVGYAFAFAMAGTTASRLALVSVGLALACQIGDLVESAVKRRFGVKDMSGLIPGHGGLFDRIDGLLFAAILAGLIALRDPAHPGQGLLIW
jgi:phosphatidate cytidylyltransferase